MKTISKKWYQVLLLELVINALYQLFILIRTVITHNIPKNSGIFYTAGCLVIVLILFLGIQNIERLNRLEANLINWCAILFLPFVLEYFWLEIFGIVNEYLTSINHYLTILVYIILIIIFSVMFIPLSQVIFSKLKYPLPRLIACVSLLFILYSNLSFLKISAHPNLTLFITNGTLGAITFFITMCFTVSGWGYSLNPNIPWDPKNNYNFSILLILIFYALIDSFWNGFSNGGSTVFDFFTHFNSFSVIHFTFNAFTQAIEAGVLEETLRYVIIIILLEWLSQKRYRIRWTIIISSLIFALAHLSNLLLGQNLSSSLVQMGLAFSSGIFYCILFLYSGKIWLVILLHITYDYLVFIQPGSYSNMDWTGGVAGLIVFLIKFMLPIAVSALILINKQYLIIKINADKLINDN